MSSEYVKIKLRRSTAAEWSSRNPVLSLGEPGVEIDTRKIKIGDGVKTWNQLSYIVASDNNPILVNTNEVIDDRIANLLVPGAGITMQYDDNANLLLIGTSGLQPSGNYATLINDKIPAIQLPSYVDDVLEFNNLASFPSSGEGDKIYVAKDSNKTYRWSGSAYIEISASPGSTDSVTEGSVNKYYTDARASAAAPVQSVNGLTGIVTIDRLVKDSKTVVLGSNGSLTLPSGSILSETSNTISLTPPTAQSGQGLVIRPTAAIWAISSSNYIEYGNPITIVVTLQNWAYFGTVNYTISGTGVTEQSLGRALTGKLTFVSTSAPDAESITWTIPANSNISEFTLTLTSVDGTRSTNIQTQNDPALYYNFEESNGMPIGQFITVTNNGISNSEHSHVHLVAGDPSTVDIYLGDDDQYVKIEKDGGDVVIGTDLNNNQWTFDNAGGLTLPNGTNIDVPSGQPRTGAIAITNSTELLIETNNDATNNLWTFGIDGSTILPENTLKGYSFTATNNVTNYIPQAASFLYTDNPILRLILTIGGAWYIKGPGLVGWKQITAAQDNSGVALILRIGSGNTPLPDGSEFPSGGGNVYTISQYVEFDLKVADKTWVFNKDGNLTLPASGNILDSNGTSILDGKASSVHTHPISDVTGLQTALDLKINSTEVDTDLAGGPGISLLYDNSNDLLSIYANNENYIAALGGRSGSTPINYDATTSSIQTLTLGGTATTFTKGTGWPTASNISVDTILRITVTSATSITWTIVNDWFSQPPAGALSIGTHLFLLRAIGSSIIEGHYIGNKTN